jgi:adenosylcobinamide kinase/adenosylcobinamide-phosphate guanylyltransferase
VLLIDCITLWVNNLLYEAERSGRNLDEAELAQRCHGVLDAVAARQGTVIFVTNEVGMDVVPENALARQYRDLVGRTNQCIAARADTVTLLVCGIPWQLKPK